MNLFRPFAAAAAIVATAPAAHAVDMQTVQSFLAANPAVNSTNFEAASKMAEQGWKAIAGLIASGQYAQAGQLTTQISALSDRIVAYLESLITAVGETNTGGFLLIIVNPGAPDQTEWSHGGDYSADASTGGAYMGDPGTSGSPDDDSDDGATPSDPDGGVGPVACVVKPWLLPLHAAGAVANTWVHTTAFDGPNVWETSYFMTNTGPDWSSVQVEAYSGQPSACSVADVLVDDGVGSVLLFPR